MRSVADRHDAEQRTLAAGWRSSKAGSVGDRLRYAPQRAITCAGVRSPRSSATRGGSYGLSQIRLPVSSRSITFGAFDFESATAIRIWP